MKINGREIKGINRELVVIPRTEGGDIAIWVEAVLDYTKFKACCPPPEPPISILPGGNRVPNFEHPAFLASVEQQGKMRFAYIVLESLKNNKIEWDTVNLQDPGTWLNYRNDMENCGLTHGEIEYILMKILQINSLDQSRLEEAKKRFLATTPASNGQIYQKGVQETTQSGVPVKDSE